MKKTRQSQGSRCSSQFISPDRQRKGRHLRSEQRDSLADPDDREGKHSAGAFRKHNNVFPKCLHQSRWLILLYPMSFRPIKIPSAHGVACALESWNYLHEFCLFLVQFSQFSNLCNLDGQFPLTIFIGHRSMLFTKTLNSSVESICSDPPVGTPSACPNTAFVSE